MNNIMWFKRGTEIVGVLCDWDLAEDHSNGDRQAVDVGASDVAAPSDKGKGKGKAIPQRRSQRLASRASGQQSAERTATTSRVQVQPRYRTGTGPFMAIDLLLQDPPPPHRYRYDLESFFYLYACVAATFDPDGQPRIFVVEQWDHTKLAMIGAMKLTFLTQTSQYFPLFRNSHRDFIPTIKGPLHKLYTMFYGFECERIVAARFVDDVEDEDTGASSAQIDDIEEKRDDGATYRRFMKLLGESPE